METHPAGVRDAYLLRTAGRGAAVAHLGRPISVALLFADGSEDAPVADQIAAAPWNGAVEGVFFGGLGLGTLFPAAGGASVGGRVG